MEHEDVHHGHAQWPRDESSGCDCSNRHLQWSGTDCGRRTPYTACFTVPQPSRSPAPSKKWQL